MTRNPMTFEVAIDVAELTERERKTVKSLRGREINESGMDLNSTQGV